ncbi:MAG: T9SS type A sorting domain-containing protein [Flavobacterium sp.]|nr:T9SS type A sorting domain-containing protein [Flavobacterium sp.]
MKNLYLFLLVFAFNLGHSQINTNVSDYVWCAPTIHSVYNLPSKMDEILINLDFSDYTYSFFHSEADAQSNTNALTQMQASFYENTVSPETIYVRVVNIQTNVVEYTHFNVVSNVLPVANSATLTFCDFMTQPTFNLADIVSDVIGGQTNMEAIFYYSMDSADNDNMYAGTTYGFSLLPQTIGAALRNTITGCIGDRVPVTLNTCPEYCNAPTYVLIPPETITSNTAIVSWTAPGALQNDIYYTLGGLPGPPDFSNGVMATVSNTDHYVITGLLPSTCYDVYVRSHCAQNPSIWSSYETFCTPNCMDANTCADNIALIAFLDENGNGIKDIGESAFTNGSYKYEVNNSGTILTGNSSYGVFYLFNSINNNPINAYDLHFEVDEEISAYYTATTTYQNIIIPIGGGSTTYYFPVNLMQTYYNLEVELIPSSSPRPGFTYTNYIRYKNTGTSTISGTISFTKDSQVSITSISESSAIISAGGFNINFINMLPGEDRTIEVIMQVPTIPTINLGDIITNSVAITPIVDDIFPVNNNAFLSQIIVGSFDPNEKTEAHGGKIAIDSFSADDYLIYTIQFENTGTASANFITIEDTLDSRLDPDSVIMLSASHPYNMRRIYELLTWNLYDINLPPTLEDPLHSKGYIQFKVKPVMGYTVGTKILNFADIYFDYNPPIFTNVCETEFVETLSTDSFDANTIALYPNPANTTVHVMKSNGLEKISSITVYDIVGKEVIINTNIDSSQVTLDTSKLNTGIYFVEIAYKNQLKFTKKLVIQ